MAIQNRRAKHAEDANGKVCLLLPCFGTQQAQQGFFGPMLLLCALPMAHAHQEPRPCAITCRRALRLPCPQDGKPGAKPSGALIVKEDQEEGQVTGRVYWQYILSYGVVSFVALILLWSSEQVGRAAALRCCRSGRCSAGGQGQSNACLP